MSRYTPNSLDRLFFHLSLSISIIVAFSLPAIYVFVAYSDLSEEVSFKARIKAIAQREMITTLPNTWMFAENRMQGVLAREPVLLENEFVQILDYDGNVLTSAGEPIKGEFIEESYPLYDMDQVVGRVMVRASLASIIHNTLISSAIGLVLGGVVLLILWMVPVKKMRRLSMELFEEKQQAEVTLQSIHDGVLRTDKKGDLIYFNAAAEKMIGRSLSEQKGKAISEIVKLFDTQTESEVDSAIYKAIRTKKKASCNGRCSLVSHDKQSIAVEEQAFPLLDSNEKLIGGVLCLSDVTIFRDQLAQQSWEASHDSLTGLINRREFEERVAKAIENAQAKEKSSLLCFMDLDGFKIVNDTSGHKAGDELLIQLAQIIQTQVRASDSLARLGGDEFGLLLDGCDEARGQIIANNILSVVKNYQFFYKAHSHTVGISIGMTSITSSSIKAEDVISEADSACYWAKESGRHRLCIFQENKAELTARQKEVSWVERIRSALKEDRFVLYHQIYQPLSKQADDRRHLEILLRLVSESGDIVLPGRFFPAAERYNLMPEIDRWVINKVFSEFHNIYTDHAGSGLMVNINLSGASINSLKLYNFIKSKVIEYSIDTTCICFEITEAVAVRNLRATTAFINACNEIGIQFALDDFGTGASSFSYLKNLPVDYLKIDGSFVKNIETDDVDRAMTETINRIGHLLGKKTIAEFAENNAIVDILKNMGVDFVQGYGVCRPTPLIIKCPDKN